MAFTATNDLMLPATVTGSWPRPRWYTQNMWGRPLDTAMMDPWYREQFTDAHAVVVSDQERAGLDILTPGDYLLDEDVAGRSWHHYPLQRWTGLEREELQTKGTRSPLLSYPVGTMLRLDLQDVALAAGRRQGRADPKNPLEYAEDLASCAAGAASGKPVKFGTVLGAGARLLPRHPHGHYDLDDEKQLIWDMADGDEPRAAPARCRGLQGDPGRGADHPLHRRLLPGEDRADRLPRRRASTTRSRGSTRSRSGSTPAGATRTCRTCFSDESYANSVEIYLDRLNADVWTIEMTENDLKELALFAPYKDWLKKKIAVGVVSHRTLQADFPEEVADRIRRALEYIPAEKLVLSTDCGFGRQGFNRQIAFYKAAAIAQARTSCCELGVEPRYVPAADEQLAWDQLPDDELFTHFKPLR